MLRSENNNLTGKSSRISILLAFIFTAGVLVLRLPEIWRRMFDPDEFEHLHAAFCLWTGMVPYRDFFEHHPPFFWLLLQPLFFIGENPYAILITSRIFMCVFLIGIFYVKLKMNLLVKIDAGVLLSILPYNLPVKKFKWWS